MKPIHIYSIAPGYRKVTVWSGSRMTNARMSVSTLTQNPGQTREQRHATIAAWLFQNFGIPGPAYREHDNPTPRPARRRKGKWLE